MLTFRLALELALLLLLAHALLMQAVVTINSSIHLQTHGRRGRRLYLGWRVSYLAIWTAKRIVDALLFAMCVNVWLKSYRDAQSGYNRKVVVTKIIGDRNILVREMWQGVQMF